jgi:hypothetical protein
LDFKCPRHPSYSVWCWDVVSSLPPQLHQVDRLRQIANQTDQEIAKALDEDGLRDTADALETFGVTHLTRPEIGLLVYLNLDRDVVDVEARVAYQIAIAAKNLVAGADPAVVFQKALNPTSTVAAASGLNGSTLKVTLANPIADEFLFDTVASRAGVTANSAPPPNWPVLQAVLGNSACLVRDVTNAVSEVLETPARLTNKPKWLRWQARIHNEWPAASSHVGSCQGC